MLLPWGHYLLSHSLPARMVLSPGAELSKAVEELPEIRRFRRWPSLRGPPGVVPTGKRSGIYPVDTFPEPLSLETLAKNDGNFHALLLLLSFAQTFTELRKHDLSPLCLKRDWEDDWFD